MTPLPHTHWTQAEIFTVRAGSITMIEGGVTLYLAPESRSYTAEARKNHIFTFDSPNTELEVVAVGGNLGGDESFFRVLSSSYPYHRRLTYSQNMSRCTSP